MKSQQEFFRTLEREVRASRERLPIDAFLPKPEDLPTDFPDPPPSALPIEVRELGTVEDAEERKRERRKQRRARRPGDKTAAPAAPQKLEDEIQEFLHRDLPPGVRPEDLSEFVIASDPSDEKPEDK
ncbi:MAG TPA: hypothetical protein VKL61_04185 [Candidatus Polarisedimenticolia bacterium]|nr:hypothetical protein [Candidatus Polarisedimenticolia bacterium]